jgi:hypothetical protein
VSDYDQLADIVLVPKDGGNVIRPELWAEAERLVEAIALIEVTPNLSLLLLIIIEVYFESRGC